LGNTSVTIHSNWIGTCNASSGDNDIYMYRSGTSWADCANSGEIQGIIVHEWGHSYDRNDGGGFDYTSEAYGDVVSMLAARESCFGPGLFTDGTTCSGYGDTCLTCTGFRDHDWAARTANTPATPQDFVLNNCNPAGNTQSPCGGGVHCESYPIGEAIFDLATRDLPAAGMDVDSAWQLVERLWYSTRQGSGGAIYTCALPNSDSCSATSWYQRMRVADDNDANLANGTPHAAELYAAFARHNIACGGPSDPENQSTTDCPTLPTPVLTITQQVNGPNLSWPPVPEAAEYQIYRGDLGCDRQQVPVATLDASTTSWLDDLPDPDIPRYYRVEGVFANPVCRSPVSNCEISGGGPRLQMNGHRLVEDGVHVNGNGLPDPGETVSLPVTLFNGGTADALGIAGRLRTVDPNQGRVVTPLVAYPDLAPGTALESATPHFQLTLSESGAVCGDQIALELDMDTAGTGTRHARFKMSMGDRNREFYKPDGSTILRQTQTPVISTLDLTDDTVIGDLDITLNISHPNRSELIVDLTSPEGTTVRLHNNSGSGSGLFDRYDLETEPDGPGVMADFNGESTAGVWTLAVSDTTYGTFGQAYLNSWTLHITSAGGFDCAAYACAETIPTEAPTGLLVDKAGSDLIFDWTGVAGASGYHILGSPAPHLATTVDLFGKTAGAVSLTMTGGIAGTPPLTFFQVRAVNSCSQESP
jgi:subtilisin-like proprotein convertase family protein